MAMDYMKETKEISAEEAIILWQASRLSLSKSYEKIGRASCRERV